MIRTFWHNAKRIIALATPVWVGQLAVIVYGVIDTAMIARTSAQDLAALAVGSAAYITVFVGSQGVVQAVSPIVGQLYGAGRVHEIGRMLREAAWLAAAVALVAALCLAWTWPWLQLTRASPELGRTIAHYLWGLVVAVPAAIGFRLFASFNTALSRPRITMRIQLGALAFKVALNWLLIFELGWGAPGCAWATLLVHTGMLALALWLLRTRELYAAYQLWQWPGRPDRALLGAFLRLGIPSGLTILVEVTSFTLMALFIARQGTTAAAAHQIAANLAAVLYMAPLAIGIASSARASYWLGAGQPARARHAVGVGLSLVAGGALLLAGTLILVREPLAAVYASSGDVVTLAAPLLLWVALYHLFDGLQALAVFVLRCWRITLAPLAIYAVLLWGLGLYGGHVLAYEGVGPWGALNHPAAFWMAGSVAMAMAALTFWLMIWRVLRK
ncbi:MAG: MATE family efflux transporter [Burkholderiales bacterium]